MTLCPALGKQNPSIPNSEHKNFLPNNDDDDDDDSLLGRFAWINKISRSQRLPCWCCCCCCANETFPLSKGLVLHARQREGYRVQTCLLRKSFFFARCFAFLFRFVPWLVWFFGKGNPCQRRRNSRVGSSERTCLHWCWCLQRNECISLEKPSNRIGKGQPGKQICKQVTLYSTTVSVWYRTRG